jgi:hypothetical protein
MFRQKLLKKTDLQTCVGYNPHHTVQETFYNFATTSHHTLLLTFQSGKNFSSH